MRLKDLIRIFLELNPKPSDQQVHQLAFSLGMDKESLESVFYDMLSDCQDNEDMSRIESSVKKRLRALSEDELVLEDEYDDASTPSEDIVLNDGEQTPTEDQSIQDTTNNDGTLVPVDDQQVLFDDGELG